MIVVFRQWWPLLLAVLAVQVGNGLQMTIMESAHRRGRLLGRRDGLDHQRLLLRVRSPAPSPRRG
jgi:hypothetical protein